MAADDEFILNKARHYCSVQERCIQEVADKLGQWKVSRHRAEEIIEQLIREDYLNEERFACLFAGGKFRINHWGKNKIIHELNRKNIPELYIQIGLQEIDDEEYYSQLKDMLVKKKREIREPHAMKRRKKLIDFGMQRGFHYALVRQVIDEIE